MMLPTVVLSVLGAALLVSGAPSHKTCCGPDDWEAMAVASAAYGYKEGSKSMSGRLAVDHSRKLATLILLKDLMDMNMTNQTSMMISMNNSDVFFYFLLAKHHQEEQTEEQKAKLCSAWVLHNAISGLENRCFPNDGSSSFIDQLRQTPNGPSLPVSLIAYNYGGLARLLALQAFASAQDCSPRMFSMSTPSNGLKLTLALNGVSSGISDSSLLSGPPALCKNVAPASIDLGGLGIGLLEAMSGKTKDNSWMDDLVTLYVISHIRDGNRRHRRDTSDVVNQTQVIEQAMELKKLLQAVQEFLENDDDDKRRDDIETGVLLDKLLTRNGQNSQPSDTVKGILLDRLLGNGNGKSSSSLSDLEKGVLLDRLLGRSESSDSDHDDVKKGILIDRLLSRRDNSHQDDLEKLVLLEHLLGDDDDDSSSSDDISKVVLFDRLLKKRDDDDSHRDDMKKLVLLDQLLSQDDDDSHEDDVKKGVLLDRLLSQHDDDDSRRDDVKKLMLLKKLLGQDDDDSHDDDDAKKVVLLDRLLSRRDDDDSRRDDMKKLVLLDQLLSQDDDDSHDDDVKKGVLLDKLLNQRDDDDSRRDDVKKLMLLKKLLGQDDDDSHDDDDAKKVVLLDRLLSRHDDSNSDDVKKIKFLAQLVSGTDRSSSDDDVNKGDLLDRLLSQRDDSHHDGGVLDLLFSRRSRRDLSDVFDDSSSRKSFDRDDVKAVVQFLIEKQLICKVVSSCGDRRKVDYSDLESLAKLLAARKLLPGSKKDKQDQFIQAAQTLLEVQAIGDLGSLARQVIRYELLDQHSKQEPDLRRLVRLGALGAVLANQKKSTGIDSKTLLELLYLEERNQQGRH